MKQIPDTLYHGSDRRIEGALKPVLQNTTADHVHSQAAVFATERVDLAAVFMSPTYHLSSIGFENDIAYICIWGSREAFKDSGGYLYTLPAASFKKVGKEYEYQSFDAVLPITTTFFDSVVDGMMQCAVQVYFIDDETIFDKIVTNKEHRAPILRDLVSENQKEAVNVKAFSREA
jgi:hypothetical protein